MTSRRKNRRSRGRSLLAVINVVLFSLMSEAAYIGIIFFTDVLKRCTNGDAFTWQVAVLCPLIFNLLCFAMLRLNTLINARYPGTFVSVLKSLGFFVLVGIVLFFFNYLLYVATVATSVNVVGSPFIPTESFWLPISLVSLVELVIMCLISLNQMASRTIQLTKESENLRESQTKAEVRALQTQLNPHFLFNSLNVLISEIEYDPAGAKKFTIDLAGAYRYILQKQDKLLVSVYDELDFLQTYIRLNRVRVGESLTYECVYPDRTNLDFLQEHYLPSLSLQLLAENALKHNVVSALKPLHLRVGFSDNLEYIVISNNRNPKKSVSSLGTGLNNLSERYRLLAGKEIMVERTSEEFRVKLPMLDGSYARENR